MENSQEKSVGFIKVLEFTSDPFTYSGQEMFIFNMYKNFNNKQIKYTFCTPFFTDNKEFLELVEKNRDKHYSYNYDYNSKNRRLYVIKALKEVLKDNNFDVVHIHSGGVFILYMAAKIAKKYGIEKVIVHSHQTGSKSLKYMLMKMYTNLSFNKYADVYFACSDLAAKWKFPKNIIRNRNYKIINNGINIEKFTFDENLRKKYRRELSLDDNITILNVGRFCLEKNHKYIVEIIKKLKQKTQNFKFIFVGSGELKKDISMQIDEIQCSKQCIFLEKRNDVAELMMASDVFILPSLFEGFPITLVEAQATGIKTICSDEITKEVCVTDLCYQLPIDEINVDDWVNNILDVSNHKVDRKKYSNIISQAGFDERFSATLLENEYLKKNKEMKSL